MPKEKVPSWVLPSADLPVEPSVLDTLGEYGGVATRALIPYFTAAGAGAAAGGIPTGGIGALPGAAGGVLSLGAADLGTGLYNLAVPAFGGQRVPMPSETIQNQFTRMGVGREPQTSGQQVFSDVLQAGAGGGLQTFGARALAPAMRTPQTRNFMQFLGQNAKGQVGAAAGGAAAPSIAANYFDVTDPSTLMGLSLAGGGAGGYAASPKIKVPTAAEIQVKAKKAYDAFDNAGIRVAQPALSQSFNNISANLRNLSFIPGNHPEVRAKLGTMQKLFQGPVSLKELDSLHSDIASAAQTITNPKTRMYMDELAHGIDDLITGVSPTQTTGGNTANAQALLDQARKMWRMKSGTKLIDDAFTLARNKADQSQEAGKPQAFGTLLQKEFASIANGIAKNERKYARLTPELKTAIKEVANGTFSSRTLSVLGSISPANIKSLLSDTALGLGTSAAIGFGAPSYLAIPAALKATATGVSAVAKPVANRMTLNRANRARMIGAGVTPPPPVYAGPLASGLTQQTAQAKQRGEVAQARRDKQQPPWWAMGL